MPLTPFHLGPGLFIGMLRLRFFNPFALLLGSVIMDLEPLILIFVRRCYFCPHHGFFHSILGAIAGSFILALLLRAFRKKLNRISMKLRLQQDFSFIILFFSGLAAWLLHILFDSLIHSDVFPFWPSLDNPILIGPKLTVPLHLIFSLLGILGLVLWVRLYKNIKKHKKFEI